MRPHLGILMMASLCILLASCLIGCTDRATNQIQASNIAQIEFLPVTGTPKILTNSMEIAIIGEWVKETLKSPISNFTLKSYPRPIHPVLLKLNSGSAQTFLISSGRATDASGQELKPGLVERLTILSFQERQYIAKSCPEALLFPRPLEP
jgi:hypothetical protein